MAMSETFETALRRNARRAYEIGRVRGSLRLGAVAAAVGLPGLFYCDATALAALCLAGFTLVVIAGQVFGQGYEEGARAGLLAGILPCLIPAVLHVINPSLCAALCANRPWLFAGAGIAAGVIIGLRARASGGLPFWTCAVLTLGFASALGCIPAGALGFGGLVAGAVVGGAPALALRRAVG